MRWIITTLNGKMAMATCGVLSPDVRSEAKHSTLHYLLRYALRLKFQWNEKKLQHVWVIKLVWVFITCKCLAMLGGVYCLWNFRLMFSKCKSYCKFGSIIVKLHFPSICLYVYFTNHQIGTLHFLSAKITYQCNVSKWHQLLLLWKSCLFVWLRPYSCYLSLYWKTRVGLPLYLTLT